jgi:hypothetical protein
MRPIFLSRIRVTFGFSRGPQVRTLCSDPARRYQASRFPCGTQWAIGTGWRGQPRRTRQPSKCEPRRRVGPTRTGLVKLPRSSLIAKAASRPSLVAGSNRDVAGLKPRSPPVAKSRYPRVKRSSSGPPPGLFFVKTHILATSCGAACLSEVVSPFLRAMSADGDTTSELVPGAPKVSVVSALAKAFGLSRVSASYSGSESVVSTR